MRFKLSLILWIFFVFYIKSQDMLEIQYMEPVIQDIIKFTEIKKSNKNLMIYSIQLSASEIPGSIKNVKNKYQGLFPNDDILEIFEPPYFKLIVGQYLDKKEAEKKLKLIQTKFKSAFILNRTINIEELLSKQ